VASTRSPLAPPKCEPAAHVSREVRIPSHPNEARRVREEIESHLKACQFTDDEIFGIKVAVEEALINAIKHGNQMDHRKKVHVVYRIVHDRFDIHITDEGDGFDPCDLPDPTMPENLERTCGRGLMLMKHYMSEVHYCERGNSVRMCKQRSR
jgi:serine/threonine-protein kinase RsbW